MEIILSIFGLTIAFITFWYSFHKRPKEELDYLKVQFKMTQKLSRDLQVELEKYIVRTNSWDQFMFPNISFKSYLDELKTSQKINLSDKLYNKLEKMNLTRSVIQSMTKSLETQFNELQKIHVEIKMRNRQGNK